jgi:hypothetical protein
VLATHYHKSDRRHETNFYGNQIGSSVSPEISGVISALLGILPEIALVYNTVNNVVRIFLIVASSFVVIFFFWISIRQFYRCFSILDLIIKKGIYWRNESDSGTPLCAHWRPGIWLTNIAHLHGETCIGPK